MTPGFKIEVRPLRKTDDTAAVSEIYAASWRAAYRGLVPDAYLDALTGARWLPKLQNLAQSGQQALLACHAGQPVGICTFCAARDEGRAGWGGVVSLYLLPGYWGKGIGVKLLGAAVAELRRQGYANLYLWVLQGNTRAEQFYRRNGFLPSGDTLPLQLAGSTLTECRYQLAASDKQ